MSSKKKTRNRTKQRLRTLSQVSATAGTLEKQRAALEEENFKIRLAAQRLLQLAEKKSLALEKENRELREALNRAYAASNADVDLRREAQRRVVELEGLLEAEGEKSDALLDQFDGWDNTEIRPYTDEV